MSHWANDATLEGTTTTTSETVGRPSMHRYFLSPLVQRSWRGMLAGVLLLPFIVCADDAKTESSSDEDAIRASVRSYVAAYNHGDAKAVAAHWSDQGQWVSPSGKKFTGKEA